MSSAHRDERLVQKAQARLTAGVRAAGVSPVRTCQSD